MWLRSTHYLYASGESITTRRRAELIQNITDTDSDIVHTGTKPVIFNPQETRQSRGRVTEIQPHRSSA